ncbi:MAG: type I DNA topoisomerase [Gammaproteobacteria bacterium]|nr:type I DNA topoisomerase [Gammaproteobacteria bacterium]
MSQNLVIVESPAKAKTIEKFLGKEFTVMSSYGHVRDLPRKGLSVDVANRFEPTYEVTEDKKRVIADLKKAVRKASLVWLASDEDREGEAIAWHLEEALDLDESNTRRIVFHEITKPAILAAITNYRTIDRNLVDGQQARRVLDRLVGFELSPVLWKKIQTGLSAGRVQSVAVRIVVDREREIEAFESVSSFRIAADFEAGKDAVLTGKLPKERRTIEEAKQFLESVKEAKYTISDISKKPAKRSPRAPFTTSTLQQAASQRLGFSVRQTMVVAQKLYESGKITYMRTDSVNLSDTALEQATSTITKDFGSDYLQIRRYKTKSAGAQEAHEAIRPTDLGSATVSGERNEQRLYQLIWQRTIASQMADARLERTTAVIDASTIDENLLAKGEVLVFDGFLKVYKEGGDKDKKMLPPLHVGQDLPLIVMRAQEAFTRPAARYTEASLVKKLEEMGIGRPSTYAPTISTIQNRGYVEKSDRVGRERTVRILALHDETIVNEDRVEITGAEKAKLFPMDIAGIVTDFLVKHFTEVVDYNFTARVEAEFDEIAAGETNWRDMIAEFYGPFHEDVEKAEGISREEASQSRQLGPDPKSGRPVSVRIGRYGPFAQIGTRDDEEKPQFAGLSPEQRMHSVTLEEVLPLFELPRIVGDTTAGEEVFVNAGRFGPYAGYVDKQIRSLVEERDITGVELLPQNVSIDPEDPHKITMEQVQSFIDAKKEVDREKEILLFEDSVVQVLDGRWGPFITDGFKNAKIPKDKDPESLTLKECQQLLEETKKVKKRLTKQFYGGGFTLLKNSTDFPDATLKVKENKVTQAFELVDELTALGKNIRVISARGAAAIRASENRKTSPVKKRAATKKKATAKKKKATKKRTGVKKKRAAVKKKSVAKRK